MRVTRPHLSVSVATRGRELPASQFFSGYLDEVFCSQLEPRFVGKILPIPTNLNEIRFRIRFRLHRCVKIYPDRTSVINSECICGDPTAAEHSVL